MQFYIKRKVGCCILIISVAKSLKAGQKKIRHWLRKRMDWLFIVFIFKKEKGTEHEHVHKAERDISMRLVQET